MSVGSPTDALFGACHVVGRIPALGVAICLGIGGAIAGAIPVTLTNPPQYESACTTGEEFFLIDIAGAGQNVSVGECLEDYDPIALAELRERCLRPEARKEDICSQL
jgi:hypothetical protein